MNSQKISNGEHCIDETIEYFELPEMDMRSGLVELLSNLMHYCHATHNLDFLDCLKEAKQQFLTQETSS